MKGKASRPSIRLWECQPSGVGGNDEDAVKDIRIFRRALFGSIEHRKQLALLRRLSHRKVPRRGILNQLSELGLCVSAALWWLP